MSAVPAAEAASRQPMLFGMTDHWKRNIAFDEHELRLHGGIDSLFVHWATYKTMPTVHYLQWARSRGAAPMINLVPPRYATDWQIAHGRQDRYLRRWARAFRRWGHPMFLRVLPEMNGKWESYSPWTRGQTAYQYRAAFRHIVRVLRSAGATNVKIVWNPDRPFRGATSLKSVWPGSAYVDWTALDVYNWRDRAHGYLSPWRTIVPGLRAVRRISHKPFMLAEIGCAPFRHKGRWVKRAVAVAHRHGVKAMVWFNENHRAHPNWRLDSPRWTIHAARRALHRSYVAFAHRTSLHHIDRFVLTGSY